MLQKLIAWFSSHRWKFAVLGALLLVLYVSLPFLLTTYARQLIRVDDAKLRKADGSYAPVDLIVALGGSLHCERELHAAGLFKDGRAPFLSVSGVPTGNYGHIADSLHRTVVAAGVPADRVIMIRDQYNTRTEARLIIQTMRQRGWRRAIVVTSGFHSRRALYTFESIAPDLEFYSVPVAQGGTEWSAAQWWTRRRDALLTIREGMSWVNTGLRGWE